MRVAAALTGANVVESRIEEWHLGRSDQALANGGYDVVVGNVPFSSHRPASGTRIATTCTTWPSPGRCRCCAPAASPPCSRHGSRSTPTTPAWRRRLAAEVDLVAAFRLPSRTHREAGTDVVTDLLILRRPLPGEQRPEPGWLEVEQLALDADTTTTVNRYWDDHPDHVLGRIEPGGAYRRENFNVVTDRPAHDALADALAPVELSWSPSGTAPAVDDPVPVDVRTSQGRPLPAGSIVDDPTSTTGFSRDGREHPCATKHRHQLRLLVTMRDRVLEYLDTPTDAGRSELADLYAAYRDVYERPLNAYDLVEVKPVQRAATTTTTTRSTRRRGSGPRSGGATRSWRGSAPTRRGGPSPRSKCSTTTPARRPRRRSCNARSSRPPGEVWPDRADTIEQAVANSLARWHRIDPGYVADQLAVDDDGRRGAAGRGRVPDAGRGVGPRRPLPRR